MQATKLPWQARPYFSTRRSTYITVVPISQPAKEVCTAKTLGSQWTASSCRAVWWQEGLSWEFHHSGAKQPHLTCNQVGLCSNGFILSDSSTWGFPQSLLPLKKNPSPSVIKDTPFSVTHLVYYTIQGSLKGWNYNLYYQYRKYLEEMQMPFVPHSTGCSPVYETISGPPGTVRGRLRGGLTQPDLNDFIYSTWPKNMFEHNLP